jgi:hypothetical protein
LRRQSAIRQQFWNYSLVYISATIGMTQGASGLQRRGGVPRRTNSRSIILSATRRSSLGAQIPPLAANKSEWADYGRLPQHATLLDQSHGIKLKFPRVVALHYELHVS